MPYTPPASLRAKYQKAVAEAVFYKKNYAKIKKLRDFKQKKFLWNRNKFKS